MVNDGMTEGVLLFSNGLTSSHEPYISKMVSVRSMMGLLLVRSISVRGTLVYVDMSMLALLVILEIRLFDRSAEIEANMDKARSNDGNRLFWANSC